jgi:basic membrane protein A and related proteins
VLLGPVSDGTFNSAAAKGIKEAQAKYPNLTVSIRENTGMAQSEAALFEYASNSYDVVIGHGFQFAEPAKKIHKQFPKTWFIINTAKISEAPNLASVDNRWGALQPSQSRVPHSKVRNDFTPVETWLDR